MNLKFLKNIFLFLSFLKGHRLVIELRSPFMVLYLLFQERAVYSLQLMPLVNEPRRWMHCSGCVCGHNHSPLGYQMIGDAEPTRDGHGLSLCWSSRIRPAGMRGIYCAILRFRLHRSHSQLLKWLCNHGPQNKLNGRVCTNGACTLKCKLIYLPP